MKLTMFTIARSFEDDPHIAITQRNSLLNWLTIGAAEIFVFGDRPGVERVCKELGITFVPGIRTNDDGLPLVSDAFERAWELASSDVVMFSNCDMLYPPYFIDVLDRIDANGYVMTGRRRNTPVTTPIDYHGDWWTPLRTLSYARGALHPAGGMDWFVHPRYLMPLPDLYVGRWWWDAVFMGMALESGAAVIDATSAIEAIHQDHSYAHAGGSMSAVQDLPESRWNHGFLPGKRGYTTDDATYKLGVG